MDIIAIHEFSAAYVAAMPDTNLPSASVPNPSLHVSHSTLSCKSNHP